ncbi:CKLF-like MARVEL transmembrane domain-containing protein 5 isoform X2 [Mobula birostris]|uniref:CKLF-like MARVEL transmembrane domain-containing protein 5 isoform X2 n=1 Tax=Mobula birostris TaxID=1983395 RepID=UPI003B27CA00
MPGSQAEPADSPLSTLRRHGVFLKSRRGIILAVEMILLFLLFVCYAASDTAFLTAPLLFLILNICFLCVYLTRYHQKLAGLSWPTTDFVRAVISALIFLILSIISSVRSGGSGMAAAAVFGFFLTGVLMYDAYDLYRTVLAEQTTSQEPAEESA